MNPPKKTIVGSTLNANWKPNPGQDRCCAREKVLAVREVAEEKASPVVRQGEEGRHFVRKGTEDGLAVKIRSHQPRHHESHQKNGDRGLELRSESKAFVCREESHCQESRDYRHARSRRGETRCNSSGSGQDRRDDRISAIRHSFVLAHR